MLKIFLLLVGFAVYGIYSFIDQLPGGDASVSLKSQTSIADQATNGIAHYAGTWVGKAAEKSGVKVERLAEHQEECKAQNVDSEKLEQVISTLPEKQRAFFEDLLSQTPSQALPSWYHGEAGQGLCFQGLDIVVMLPKKQE